MKAKLGNTIIDFWKISTSKPENEPWVLESFEKKADFLVRPICYEDCKQAATNS
ncbi:hypothetical protein [Lactococcus cremoris]|uniref:hypothetical protein n=1 Tax=Lactococcus lactis subsp. cremoris TaxID=1359 RepID=UPI0002D47545|nr:hypothetical protein [Lactococcus cremoris]